MKDPWNKLVVPESGDTIEMRVLKQFDNNLYLSNTRLQIVSLSLD